MGQPPFSQNFSTIANISKINKAYKYLLLTKCSAERIVNNWLSNKKTVNDRSQIKADKSARCKPKIIRKKTSE
jgi:hypothetical protein